MDPFEPPSDSSARPRVLAPDLEPDVNCAAAVAVPVLISADAEVAEWLARLIHHRSSRQPEPFFLFRPGRGDQLGLLKGLLNGYRRKRGTLYVADISRAIPEVQVLLRDMLAAPQPDPHAPFRVIGGTSNRLFEQVESGAFDDRLFYRLNKIHIRVGSREGADRAEAGSTERPETRTRYGGMDVAAFRRHRTLLRTGQSAMAPARAAAH
jgi:hypothetical protein